MLGFSSAGGPIHAVCTITEGRGAIAWRASSRSERRRGDS